MVWCKGPSSAAFRISECEFSRHLYSSIKEPWRRSSRDEALCQRLITNQPLDKLTVFRIYFRENGILNGSVFDLVTEHPVAHAQNSDGDPDEGCPVKSQGIGALAAPRGGNYKQLAAH